MRQLTFEKDFWSSSYQIKNEEQVVVKTKKESVFSYDTTVKVENKEFFFDVKGFFSNTANIYTNNNLIGTVEMETWGSDAIINLNDEGTFKAVHDGVFTNEWRIIRDSEVLIHFKKDWFSSEGTIDIFQENESLLATGIFLVSIQQQKQAAAGA